jgi:hypothetical protein
MAAIIPFNYTPTFCGIWKMAFAIGYNLLSAILELTDNSIPKSSTKINVIFEKTDKKPYLLDRITVFDNGDGMNSDELKQSFIIAATKTYRNDTDIGAFCVGMKYATMNLGSLITIISKVEGGSIVGLHANVEQMKINNSFAPTEFCSSVDEEWAMKYLTPGLFSKFEAAGHGTLIHISSLYSKTAIRYEVALDEVKKGLAVAYSSLYNECIMTVYNGASIESVIHPIDMFYTANSEKLDEDPYETQLDVFRGDNNTERIIEVNTMRRPYAKNKKTTGGRCGNPQFIEWFYRETPTGLKKLDSRVLRESEVPDYGELIGTLNTRTIQVKKEFFDEEKNYFPEGTPLHRDRKRFWFYRKIRCVATANPIGKKFNDRASTCCERQRTQCKFAPDLDDKVGSKFNKSMGTDELPCRLLRDVIVEVHRSITTAWDDKWKEDTTVPSQDERSDDEEEELIANPFLALYPPAAPNQEANIPIVAPEPIAAAVPEPVPIAAPVALVPEPVPEAAPVPAVVSRGDAFLSRFGFTIERYAEATEWLAENSDV